MEKCIIDTNEPGLQPSGPCGFTDVEGRCGFVPGNPELRCAQVGLRRRLLTPQGPKDPTYMDASQMLFARIISADFLALAEQLAAAQESRPIPTNSVQ